MQDWSLGLQLNVTLSNGASKFLKRVVMLVLSFVHQASCFYSLLALSTLSSSLCCYLDQSGYCYQSASPDPPLRGFGLDDFFQRERCQCRFDASKSSTQILKDGVAHFLVYGPKRLKHLHSRETFHSKCIIVCRPPLKQNAINEQR